MKPEHEQEAQAVLQKIALFSGFPEDLLKAMASLMEAKAYKAGKVIIMEQEINRTLYILTSGTAGIWRREGGEKKVVALLEAPNFFGEMSMFLESPATALVKAEKDCLAFSLEKDKFNSLLEKFPTLATAVQIKMEAIAEERPPLVKAKPEEPKPEE